MPTTHCVWLLVLLLTPAAIARGQAPGAPPSETTPAPAAPPARTASPEEDRIARGLFEAGTLSFREGRYDTALQQFQEAYRLSQRPLLLFNIGSTLDRLRRDREALATFEQYLIELPQAPNAAAITSRIELLKEAIAAQDAERARNEQLAREAAAAELAAQSQPVTTPAGGEPTARESDGLPPVVFWIGVGATGVAGALSVWSGLDTVSANDDYLAAPTKRAYEDAHGKQSRTNILIGLSAGLAVTTVVLALLTDWDGGTEAPTAGLQPVVTAHGVGCIWSGSL